MSVVSALTLLVLRCSDLERARSLYESLGLTMRPEQHGSGPLHYSAVLGPTILELYPQGDTSTRGLRLGLRVAGLPEVLAADSKLGATILSDDLGSLPPRAVIQDFDGHKIELVEEDSPVICTIDGSR